MRKILTLGIPAYNVEKYLAECLDSVINEELEVLIINDGSKDNTEKIALEYQKKYPEIFRVITKVNGGWGSGVNLAIKEAKGIYFKNLDSDDTFDKEGLAALITNMKESNADIIISPSLSRDDKSGTVYETHMPNGTIYEKTINLQEMLDVVDSVFWMHCLAFKTELLQKNNVVIDECFYTDMELAAYPLEYAKTAFAQKEPVYIYRTGRAGQSMSLPSMAKHMKDRETVTNSMVDKFFDGNKSAYFKKMVLTSIYSYLTQPFTIKDSKQRDDWVKKLREFKETVIDQNVEFSDYNQYLFFAKVLLKNNFKYYSEIAAIWRFGKTKIAPVYHLYEQTKLRKRA